MAGLSTPNDALQGEPRAKPEQPQAGQDPKKKHSLLPRHWPWSKCPAGTGVSFRRCCGRAGDDECHYVPEDDETE